MKRLILWGAGAALSAAVLLPSFAQKKPLDNALAGQMQEKLAQSQQVLRGLATEDFDLIAKNGQKLRALADANSLAPGPEFNEHATAFKRNVNSLLRAASQKNIDAATLAYMGMTLNCVECHKALRGRKVAGLGLPETRF